MKLPSLDYLVRNSAAALGRFPWVLAMAALATGLAITMNEVGRHPAQVERLTHFMMAVYLGISLQFGLSMLMERLRPRLPVRMVVHISAVGLLALYAWSLKGHPEFVIGARYSLFLLASHLFVAVAPWLSRGHTGGFWEYNHRLFLRIILASIFSACLFAGTAGALAAVKHLFTVPIPDKAFLYLWLAVTGVFNTWFFLAGVPDDFRDLDLDHPYPRALKVLAQYILVPVVTLYLVILYAYAAKIAMQREWPIGWVSYLVLVCALLGLLSLLLVHPIQERSENRWVKGFARGFFLALFPLLILLFAAIGRRIADYRITENRYFVLAMACWLTGIGPRLGCGP